MKEKILSQEEIDALMKVFYKKESDTTEPERISLDNEKDQVFSQQAKEVERLKSEMEALKQKTPERPSADQEAYQEFQRKETEEKEIVESEEQADENVKQTVEELEQLTDKELEKSIDQKIEQAKKDFAGENVEQADEEEKVQNHKSDELNKEKTSEKSSADQEAYQEFQQRRDKALKRLVDEGAIDLELFKAAPEVYQEHIGSALADLLKQELGRDLQSQDLENAMLKIQDWLRD